MEKYMTPKLEIVTFEIQDVITTSPVSPVPTNDNETELG